MLFDLDDTLRVNDPHPHEAFTQYVSSLGIALSEDVKKKAYRWGHAYWANSTTLLDDFEKHKGYEDPFWQNYTRRHLEALDIHGDQIETIASQVHAYMGRGYRPQSKLVPDCLETIAQLRESGFLVGLLTNRTRPIYKEMLELGLDHELDIFLTGGQLDAFKPQVEFFDKALELLKVPPQEALYVGDNFFADIQGAEKANLLPVLIDPRGLYPENKWPTIQTIGEVLSLLKIEAHVL